MANARGQGRKPKPTAEKIRNGSAAHNPQRINRAEPAALPAEPIMPTHLDDIARAEWHGPYFYRFWREGGRLRKAYVKRSEADAVAARCQARRQLRTERDDSLADFRRLLDTLREIERNGCT